MARTLAHLQRDREDADYATTTVFTDPEASAAIADAQAFLSAVRLLIASSD